MQVFKQLAALGTLALSLLGASAAPPAPAESTLAIGMSAPFSGPNAAYGQEMRHSIRAYFEQINKAGGVNGRKLELLALDDGYESERTLANTRQLIEERKVFALLAFYGSTPTTEAMNQVFGPARVPLVGSISGAGSLRETIAANPNARYMFNVRASYADETQAIVNQMVGLGLKNIAVVFQNDGYGKSGLDGVSAALKAHGLTPSAAASVERNSLDVGKAVAEISRVRPQAVVAVTLYKPTAAFVRAMRKLGQNPMFMTLSPVGTEQLVEELGSEARGIGISQVVPYPWNDVVPVVRDYQKLLGRDHGYSYYGLEGYLMARTLVEGLKRCGKEISRERLVAALEGITTVDFGGFTLNYDSSAHNGSNFVELTVVGPGGKLLK